METIWIIDDGFLIKKTCKKIQTGQIELNNHQHHPVKMFDHFEKVVNHLHKIGKPQYTIIIAIKVSMECRKCIAIWGCLNFSKSKYNQDIIWHYTCIKCIVTLCAIQHQNVVCQKCIHKH